MQSKFKDFTDAFQPMADKLESEGMGVYQIAKVFSSYVLCKIRNNQEPVETPETFDPETMS